MNNQIGKSSVYDTTIRLFILLLIVAWCLAIMYPFASIMLWSLILAIAMYPLHKMLSEKMGGRPKLASFIIIFFILAIIFFPTWLLIDSLFREVREVKVMYDNGTLSIPPPTERVKELPVIGEKIHSIWNNAYVDLEKTIVNYKDQIAGVGKKLATGILSAAGGVIQIMAALIIAGIMLCFGGIGESIRKFFRKVAGNKGDEFADVMKMTVGNVVKGIIGVALILAVLHGIVFMLAGVPLAGIWTLIVFVLAVLQIPLFIVIIPVLVYIFATKTILASIIWGIVLIVVGFSDNILKPILLGKGAPVPMLVIFIGVIGGFIFSGFLGLFTGAIIMSIGYKLFVAWINTPNEADQV